MRDPEPVEIFSEHTLFKGLSAHEIETLKKTSTEQEFEPNHVIIEEGDLTQDIYLLVAGEVAVLKWNETRFSQILLGTIIKGEMFGEMSFLDGSPRSSTIKALKKTKVLKIARDSAALNPETFAKIVANIASANINRLRGINRQFVKNLERKEEQTKIQESIGHFLLFQYLILGFSIFAAWLYPHPLQAYLPWVIALLPSIILLKVFKFPLNFFGIRKDHLFKIVLQALAFVFIIMIFAYLLEKYALSNSDLSAKYFSLKPQLMPLSWSWAGLALYAFAQEFIGRGILQNSLQKLLNDKKRSYFIWLNGCFLFLFFLPLGLTTSAIIFFINLPLGYFFNLEKNLAGVFLIHYLLLLCKILIL